jgi:hypothetical protein
VIIWFLLSDAAKVDTCRLFMGHNDGGMVSWGLDTDNLSAQ